MIAAPILFLGIVIGVIQEAELSTINWLEDTKSSETGWQTFRTLEQPFGVHLRNAQPDRYVKVNKQVGGRPLTQGELKALIRAGYKIYPMSVHLAQERKQEHEKHVLQMYCRQRQ